MACYLLVAIFGTIFITLHAPVEDRGGHRGSFSLRILQAEPLPVFYRLPSVTLIAASWVLSYKYRDFIRSRK